MKKVHVQTTINGEETEFLCEPRQSLLEVLRDVVGYTGTKEGCLTGGLRRVQRHSGWPPHRLLSGARR